LPTTAKGRWTNIFGNRLWLSYLFIHLILCDDQSDLAQTFNRPFKDVFEFYVVFDQHSATGRKIWLELEQIFDGRLAFVDPSQQPQSRRFDQRVPE
jgi:hypothetical protein